MEIAHELILGTAEIDRLAIKCRSCGAEFVVSLNLLSASGTDESSTSRQIPKKCPSCPRDWSDVHKIVREFSARLEELKQCDGLSFRVPMPASEPRR
jgi:hypothetical protein